MAKFNAENERIKRDYYDWLRSANRRCESTIDNIRKSLDRFEAYTECRSFKRFNKDQAKGFKKYLLGLRNTRTKKPLSQSTIITTCRNLKDFFKWLAYKPGYRRLDVNEIEYFNLLEKEVRAAQGRKIRRGPTIEQVMSVIENMPIKTEIQLRDRAMIAFTLLTGVRDGALVTLRLKHVNLKEELVEQLPQEVSTKFGKTIYTFFFPVGDQVKEIVGGWIDYLYSKKLFNDDDPLFPLTKITLDKNNTFKVDGIEPEFWQSANRVREIFKEAFENVGLEYFSPHSFRRTLARLGEKLCQTPEEFKAWSQNLGHEQVLTTFISYGQIDELNQGEIIKALATPQKEGVVKLEDINEKLDLIIRQRENNTKNY